MCIAPLSGRLSRPCACLRATNARCPLGDENPPKPNACDYKLFDIKTPEGFEKHDISDLIAPTTPNIWADKVDEKDVIDFFNKLAEQKKKRDKEKRSDDDDWTDTLPNQSDYDN